MTTLIPEMFNNRSLLYRRYDELNPQYLELANGAIANYSSADCSSADSAEQLARSALIDLSLLPRLGFRGTNAATYLQQSGLELPERPNQSVAGNHGEQILRLSKQEYWVLGNLQSDNQWLNQLSLASLPTERCYKLFCQDSHAWLMLTGRHLADIMAKVCGVDLRASVFPTGAIAQTSVARVNAIIISHQVNGIAAFSILSDSASAEYLWGALLDAMQEFEGQVVGYSALQ